MPRFGAGLPTPPRRPTVRSPPVPDSGDLAVRFQCGVRRPAHNTVTGLIAGETDAGLTLRRAEKLEEAILRTDIAEITTSGKSLMPEGLEQKIKPDEMADLIAYLKGAGG